MYIFLYVRKKNNAVAENSVWNTYSIYYYVCIMYVSVIRLFMHGYAEMVQWY